MAVPDGLGNVERATTRTEIDATRDGGDGTRIAGGDGDTAIQGERATESRSATLNGTTASGVNGGVGVTSAVVIENDSGEGVTVAGEVEDPWAIDDDRIACRDLAAVDVHGKSAAIDDDSIRRIRCERNGHHPGCAHEAQGALAHNGATGVGVRGRDAQHGTSRLDEGNRARAAADGGGRIDNGGVDENRGLIVVNDQLGVAAGGVTPCGKNTAYSRGSDGGVVVVVASDDAAHLKVEDIRGRTEGNIDIRTSCEAQRTRDVVRSRQGGCDGGQVGDVSRGEGGGISGVTTLPHFTDP